MWNSKQTRSDVEGRNGGLNLGNLFIRISGLCVVMRTRDLTSTSAVLSTARVGVFGSDTYCVGNYLNCCIIEQLKQAEGQKLCQKKVCENRNHRSNE